MNNLKIEDIQSAIKFTNAVTIEVNESYRVLFHFMEGFSNIYDNEKKKLPYHINIIDELHANENAHSRIFAKLLRYEQNGKFLFLENFLKEVCKFNLAIKNPKVEKVDSCGRIDIPIFDDDFVVVIENKVTDQAPDQNNEKGGQLARYIETIRDKYNRDLENIYVLYMPKFTREPSEECWLNSESISYKESFKDRFKSLSYQDEIYPWLKNDLLVQINKDDKFLSSALEQYIDYLEGVFSLRAIDKKMNMELQSFIKNELGLDDNNPKDAIAELSKKENQLENAIVQIQQLKSKYQREIITSHFQGWKIDLNKDFPSFKITENSFEMKGNLINGGVEFTLNNEKYTALIECNNCDMPNIYFGIHCSLKSSSKFDVNETIQELLDKNELNKPDDLWYGWKYSELKDVYLNLKQLIKQIENLESPNR